MCALIHQIETNVQFFFQKNAKKRKAAIGSFSQRLDNLWKLCYKIRPVSKDLKDTKMDITLLTKEQVFGDNALKVLKVFGSTTAPTDLAALQLCWVFPQGKTTEGKRSAAYYIQADDPTDLMQAPCISPTGEFNFLGIHNPQGGVRPIIPAYETANLTPQAVSELKIRGKGTVQVVSFGLYPQKMADEQTQQRLNQLFIAGLKPEDCHYIDCGSLTALSCMFKESSYTPHDSPLRRTHRKFTMDNRRPGSYDIASKPRTYPAFRLGDKMYIHFFPIITGDAVIFANNRKEEKPRNRCWVEVCPVEWLVDPSGVWVAKDILLSNIRFDDKSFPQRTGLFQKSSLNQFLTGTFAPQLLPPVRLAHQRRKVRTNSSRQRV